MVSFFLAISMLVAAYFTYGKFVEGVFGADDERITPSREMADGVDYVEMDWKRVFLIQFLNIAGLGPIFGAIAGVMWGTASYIWIVLGCIFAGAVHDYMAGMISIRHGGRSIPELVGIYLGRGVERVTRVLIVVLLVIVGVAFVNGPAEILTSVTRIPKGVWIGVITGYYILATILPINKIIGRIYPVFGAALIFMGVGILAGLFTKGYHMPEVTLANLHPKGTPMYPFMFVVISCGAISGFHATQSTLMARCLKRESEGRRVFYGSMLAEGMTALIWAAVAIAFFGTPEGIAASGGGAVAVNKITNSLLGRTGAVVAFLGVIACPISTGDTAFRSVRITVSEFLNIKQERVRDRVLTSLPIFALGGFLAQFGFSTIWRYVASTNQMLATITLWVCAEYLRRNGKSHWICSGPAIFMTTMITTYMLMAKEGLGVSEAYAYPSGAIAGVGAVAFFLFRGKKESAAEIQGTI